jgi:hypothetical protein
MGSAASTSDKNKSAEKKTSSVVVLAGEKPDMRVADSTTSSKIVGDDEDSSEDIWAAMSEKFLSAERFDYFVLTFGFFCILLIDLSSGRSDVLAVINESWTHLSGQSAVIDSVVALSTGLLSLAQNAPFAGPAAGALLMFYQTYEQCQENKVLFEDLREKVDYCKAWIEEMSDKRNLVSSHKVVVSSYKDFFLVLSRAIRWMRQASTRYKKKPSLLKRVRGMILAEVDQTIMTDHIARIDSSLMHFKTDITAVLMLNSKSQTELKEFLHPFEFKDTIYKLKRSFLQNSRKWILDLFEEWLFGISCSKFGMLISEGSRCSDVHDSSYSVTNSNVFWIRADAGMGKSVLAAKLADSYSERLLGAVFFNFTDTKLSDPSSVINSLAYQISEKYPEVASEVIVDAKNLAEAAISDRFEKLVIDPLNKVLAQHEKIPRNGSEKRNFFLIIDALDECELGEKRNELLNFLGNQLIKKLPKNVKILITSRPEHDIVTRLQGFKPFEIKEKDPRHEEDLKLFISSLLPKEILQDKEVLLRAVDMVFTRSEGKFIYASLVKQELESCLELSDVNELMNKLGELPEGIDEYFLKYFKKLGNYEFYKEFLYCMVASMETLSVQQLKALGLEKKLKQANDNLGKLFCIGKVKKHRMENHLLPFLLILFLFISQLLIG